MWLCVARIYNEFRVLKKPGSIGTRLFLRGSLAYLVSVAGASAGAATATGA